MSTPSKTFFLSEPADMYFKLRWDYSQLVEHTKDGDRRATAYRALNAAMSALHMYDWIHLKLTSVHYQNLQRAGIDVCNSRQLREFAMKYPPFALCESVANAAKHLHIDRPRPRDVTTDEAKLSRLEAAAPDLWIPMVEDGQSSMPLHMAVGETIRFWEQILLVSGLATAMQLKEPRLI